VKNALGAALQRGAAFQFSVCGFRRGPGRAQGGGGLGGPSRTALSIKGPLFLWILLLELNIMISETLTSLKEQARFLQPMCSAAMWSVLLS